MYFRKTLSLVAFILVLPLALFGLPDRPQFAQETSDLKPDSAARFGTLPNGLRYVIMANKEPKDRVSLRLLVMAGSMHESESQRGLAHYLEHMAFNGSAHYAPGTLVEFFQRMGMSFGGDTNAYTSHGHTAYKIELPDTKPATIEEGLRVFADFAGTLLLGSKEVDKERGIILSEKRARDSVEYREAVASYEFVLGGTRIPDRMPIGLVPVIEQAKREQFADFYNTWYRPERMAIIAVGDFNPDAIEAQIKTAFGSVAPRSPAPKEPDLGKIAQFDGVKVMYRHEPEASATSVVIQIVTPYSAEPDTSAKRLEHLPRDLAAFMLNRRLNVLAKKEGAPFTSGGIEIGESYDFCHQASINIVCKPDVWREALGVAEQELRRAQQFGFQPEELAEATANFRNELEQAVKTASTRRSDDLAHELIEALTDGQVFTSPTDDLNLFGPVLSKLTVDECTKALRKAFASTGRYVYVMGNATIEGDAAAAIKSAYESSAAVALTAPEKVSDIKFAYTDFGPFGKVMEKKHVEDLDLWLVTFSNGVRLNLKKTDFEAGSIRISVRIGAGQLIEPRDKPGLSVFASSTFVGGGLGRHSLDELQRILAGKTVGAKFTVGSDALVFTAGTNMDDLQLQLQLLTAFVTDPGYRQDAVRQAEKDFDQLYKEFDHTPDGPLQREIPRWLASGDTRFGFPPKEILLARTSEEARAWLSPQLKDGSVEIAIAGDLDIDAAIDRVAKTFGALAPRKAKPPYEAERRVFFPSPFTKEIAVQSEIPKGYVALFWPTTDARDVRITRRLRLLSAVFYDRLRVKIREQLGESYAPEAQSESSETYRDYGMIAARITVDPTKAAKITEAALSIADDIVKNGVSADELERAKKPTLTALRESARTNAYWVGAVLSSVQEFPERLEWCRSRYSDNEAITAAELNELAKKYLPSSRCFQFTIVPGKNGAVASPQ